MLANQFEQAAQIPNALTIELKPFNCRATRRTDPN